ncbi:MAG: hypothetical protein DRN01_04485, partial [Thermoplasmata archaeon]
MRGYSTTISKIGGNIKMRRLEKVLCLTLVTLMLITSLFPIVYGTSLPVNKAKDDTTINHQEEQKNQTVHIDEKSNRNTEVKTVSYETPSDETVSTLLEKWKGKGFLPGLYVYTNCNGIEKRTKLLKGLLKPIDVDNDGDNDINVILRMRPTIVFSPLPALAFMTKLTVKRLNSDIKTSDFEIAAEVSLPRLFGGNVRFGYHSPDGETMPQICTLTYTSIPHIISFKKPEHILDINPVMGAGDTSELILLATFENATDESTSSIGIKYNPAVHAKIKWGKTRKLREWSFTVSKDFLTLKETTATLFFKAEDTLIGVVIDKLTSASFNIELKPFSKEGGGLHYEKKSMKAADISLIIQTTNISGSLDIHQIPKKIDIAWLLRAEGFIEINTYGEDLGEVEATITDVAELSFNPQTDLDVKISWGNISFKNKSFDLEINASVYIEVVDMNFDLISVDENVSDEPIITSAIKNGVFHLEGNFDLFTALKLGPAQGNSSLPSVNLPNSTIVLTLRDANITFHADNVLDFGEVNLEMYSIDTVKISLLDFNIDSIEGLPWINASILIDASHGEIHLADLDIQQAMDFGHVYMKNVTGTGLMRTNISSISIYLIKMGINNSENTRMSVDEFSFQFYGVPIVIYDTVFIEGTAEIWVNMTLSEILMLDIINAGNAESFGLRIGYKDGWNVNYSGIVFPSEPILPYAFVFFDHPTLPFNLKILWYSVGPWNNPDWNPTDEEFYNAYYGPTGFNWAFNGYILVDTGNVSQPAIIGVAAPNDTIGFMIDSGMSLKADNFRFVWNVTKFMGTFNVFDLIGALSLDGYLKMQNIGELWACANGDWRRVDQSGPGYFVRITPGHLQMGGNKTVNINETIHMMGTELKIAGNFSLNTDNGTVDIWFNKTSVRIGGTVNYTVRNFYFSVGENFSITADIFHFNLGTSSEGSIEISPTISGSGRIELKDAVIKLENCSIVFIGFLPIPNIPPQVTIATPSENDTVSDTVTIAGSAYDVDDGVMLVQVSIDGNDWQNATGTENWSYSWDTTTLPNGRYKIEARAFDGFDYSNIALVNVTVNNTGVNWRPTVTIQSPKDGDKVEGLVHINGTALDPDGTVTLVQVSIDGGDWQNATGTNTWSYTWNTTGLMGKHSIKTRSYDGVDFSRISTVTVTVKAGIGGVIEFSLVNASIEIINLSIKLITFNSVLVLADEGVSVEATVSRLHLSGGGNIYAEFGPDGGVIRTTGDGGSNLEIYTGLLVKSSVLKFNASFTMEGASVGPLEFSWNETAISFSGNLGVGSLIGVNISDLFFEFNNITVMAEWVAVEGSATFNFILGTGQAVCNISSAHFSARNLYIRAEEYSSEIYVNLEFTGSFSLQLTVSDYVTFAEGHIIVGGSTHIQLDTPFNINGTEGSLKGEFFLSSNSDVVEIKWNETTFSIDGSGAFSITGLQFIYGDIINVTISSIEGAFSVSDGGKEGYVEFSGDTSFSADVDFDHVDENLTLQGA